MASFCSTSTWIVLPVKYLVNPKLLAVDLFHPGKTMELYAGLRKKVIDSIKRVGSKDRTEIEQTCRTLHKQRNAPPTGGHCHHWQILRLKPAELSPQRDENNRNMFIQRKDAHAASFFHIWSTWSYGRLPEPPSCRHSPTVPTTFAELQARQQLRGFGHMALQVQNRCCHPILGHTRW